MKAKELESMTLPELKNLAKTLEVAIPSRMRKAEVVVALSAAMRAKAGNHKPKKQAAVAAARGGGSVSPQSARSAGSRTAIASPPPGRGVRDVKSLVGISEEERVEVAKYAIAERPSPRREVPPPSKVSRPPARIAPPTGRIETPVPPVWREEAPTTLPEGYKENRVTLMARDPYWAHAYWEVGFGVMDRAREVLRDPDARLNLRIFDATGISPERALTLFDVEVFQRIGNWYLELGRPDRTFFVEVGMKGKDGRFYSIARSNPIHTPSDRVSDLTDVEWMISDEEFRRLFAISGGHGIGLSSAEMVALIEERFRGQISSPGIWSGAASLFSPGRVQEKRRGFWFWVDTELIVYGATEPDATVSFQGKPVPLKPDGTFTLRFALPDGIQVMPIQAISADREEERMITPIVSRETK